MKCLTPSLVKNPNYRRGDDPAYQFVEVPCGKCPLCRKNMRREWVFRNQIEINNSKSAWFFTLTYDNDHLPINDCGYSTLSKRDVQLFFKRLRKAGYAFRYFLCGEYGKKTKRPHYHALIYNFSKGDKILTLEEVHAIFQKTWSNGFVYPGVASPAACGYTSKYIAKGIEENRDFGETDQTNNFLLCSKYPPIGSVAVPSLFAKWLEILDEVTAYHDLDRVKDLYVTNYYGKWYAIPRYFRKKFWEKIDPDGRFDKDDTTKGVVYSLARESVLKKAREVSKRREAERCHLTESEQTRLALADLDAERNYIEFMHRKHKTYTGNEKI